MELVLLVLVAVVARGQEVPVSGEEEPSHELSAALYDQVPTTSSFYVSLYQSQVKPQVLDAYNASAELNHWKQKGNPSFLQVTAGDAPAFASISDDQVVLSTSYKDGVKFHYFNTYDEKDVQGKVIGRKDKLVDIGWDAKLPLKVIVHGFAQKASSPWVVKMKNAYLRAGKYNVIVVDWSKLSRAPLYVAARTHVPGTGAKVGLFLDKLIKSKLVESSLVHVIGYNLGAHVAGIAGKHISGAKLKRVTGLDPARPLFELTKPEGRISRDDAEVVDVIHTSTGYLGLKEPIGTIDFYVHKSGLDCGEDVFGVCSSSKSYELFTTTIEAGRGFEGSDCRATSACNHVDKKPETCNCVARRCKKDCAGMKIIATMGDSLSFKEGGPYVIRIKK